MKHPCVFEIDLNCVEKQPRLPFKASSIQEDIIHDSAGSISATTRVGVSKPISSILLFS